MVDEQVFVEVVETAGALDGLRPFWVAHNRHPEASADFVQMLCSTRANVVRPHIIVARRGQRVVAMLVGRIERSAQSLKLGYWQLFALPLTQLVVVPDGFLGEPTQEVLTAILDRLRTDLRSSVVDRVVLSSVPIDSGQRRMVHEKFSKLQCDSSSAPIERWLADLPNTFDGFLSRFSSKRRYWLRRIGKVFEKQFSGRFAYQTMESTDQVDAFCTAAEIIARKTYQRGLGAGFMDNNENRQRLMASAKNKCFLAHVAYVDGVPIAFWAGERSGDVMHILWTGYDKTYQQFEIGTILLLRMIEHLISKGISKSDFGLGGAWYKQSICDRHVVEQNILIYSMSIKGLAFRMLSNLQNVLNSTAKRLAVKLGIADRMKKNWRAGLAAKAGDVGAGNSGPTAAGG